MQKSPIKTTYILVLIAAMLVSFVMGGKFAAFKMYREQLAQASLAEIAAGQALDKAAADDLPDNNNAGVAPNETAINNNAEPSAEQAAAAAPSTAHTSSQNKPAEIKENPSARVVNINTAGKSELISLPGIGEVKAQAIIDYREKYGKFYSTEEIMNVKGIGEKTYASLKDLICV